MPRILGRNSGGRSDSRLVPVAGERQPEGMSQLLPSSLLALAYFFFSVNSAWGIGTLLSPPPSVVTMPLDLSVKKDDWTTGYELVYGPVAGPGEWAYQYKFEDVVFWNYKRGSKP